MIETLIINSFVIFGAHASTRDGMILYFVNKFVTKRVLKFFLLVYKDGKPTGRVVERMRPRALKEIEYESVLEIRDATERASKSTSFILKPLFDCPPCMASIWGIPFMLIHPINIWSAAYLFALCGINYIIMKLISR